MRIPDWFKLAVGFLSVESGGITSYGGTAFFIQYSENLADPVKFNYLVTAKHCVETAYKNNRKLSCRLNKEGGGIKLIDLPAGGWVFSVGSDVAITPCNAFEGVDFLLFPNQMFLTDEKIKSAEIGMGDELFIVGLFTQHFGKTTNIPILRSGIIAAMPDELMRDRDTGEEFKSYLIESRSIGGLSGSPVFMALKKPGVEMHPPPRGFNTWQHELVFLGLVRGHFDLDASAPKTDFMGNTESKLNMGIAMVTPIQEVALLLQNPSLADERQALKEQLQEQSVLMLSTGFLTIESSGL